MLLNDFRPETDPESLHRRDRGQNLPMVLTVHWQVGVCHDCRQIVTDGMAAQPGAEQDSIRVADLRSLVGDALPHTRHSVVKDAILNQIDSNAGWVAAVKDYWAHREEVHAVHFERYRMMRTTGVSSDAARRALVPTLVAAAKLPAVAPEAWFDWMIAESERLSRET